MRIRTPKQNKSHILRTYLQSETDLTPKINNNGIDVEVANFIETTIRRKELSKNKEEQNISRYNEGQKIDAKISSIDLTNRKFSLSIRQLEIDEEQSLLEKYGSKSSGSVLGDILGKALDEDKVSKEE